MAVNDNSCCASAYVMYTVRVPDGQQRGSHLLRIALTWNHQGNQDLQWQGMSPWIREKGNHGLAHLEPQEELRITVWYFLSGWSLRRHKTHINNTLTNNSYFFSPSPFMNTGSSDSCTAGRKNSCHSVACFRNLSGWKENSWWRVRHKWSPWLNNTTEETETLAQESISN